MTEKQMFDKFVSAGMTPFGAAGLMGNLYAESGLRCNNLQNSFEKSLRMTDEQYTAAVDSGTYKNFVTDRSGYGLAQWTYHTRKQNLLNFANARHVSISDPVMQTDFLIQELRGYGRVWEILTTTNNLKVASDAVLLDFERPRDQSERMKNQRAKYGQEIFDRCSKSPTTQQPSAFYINGLDYSPVFNIDFYKKLYPDLQIAFKDNSSKYWEHFKTYGMKEGRQGSANFNVLAYKNYHPDLQKAFGNQLDKYYQHYLLFGKNEGRKCT